MKQETLRERLDSYMHETFGDGKGGWILDKSDMSLSLLESFILREIDAPAYAIAGFGLIPQEVIEPGDVKIIPMRMPEITHFPVPPTLPCLYPMCERCTQKSATKTDSCGTRRTHEI